MRLNKLIIFLLGLWIVGCDVNYSTEPTKSIGLENANQNDIIIALTASNSFLEKIDAGKVESTWKDLSAIIKNDISESIWSKSINSLRLSTGSLTKRLESKAGFTESLPNTPAGKYFIFEYQSKFKKIDAKEKVVLSYENGDWKIVGYFMTKSITKVTKILTP